MYDQHSFYTCTPKLVIIALWLSVWSRSNFHIILFRVPQFTVWSFKVGCAELFEMQADKKYPSIHSLFPCFSDALVTWPCDVIAVSHILDMKVIYSYFQPVLHRHNIWLSGHHKTMANFMSVALCTTDAGIIIITWNGLITCLICSDLVCEVNIQEAIHSSEIV